MVCVFSSSGTGAPFLSSCLRRAGLGLGSDHSSTIRRCTDAARRLSCLLVGLSPKALLLYGQFHHRNERIRKPAIFDGRANSIYVHELSYMPAVWKSSDDSPGARHTYRIYLSLDKMSIPKNLIVQRNCYTHKDAIQDVWLHV